MKLPFMKKFPKDTGTISNQPTYFPEKIIRSLPLSEYKLMSYFDLLNEVLAENEILPITDFQNLKPKPHTIRQDKKDRWKVGNKVHFYINARTKNQFQFAPVLEVKSIQKIYINPFAEVCRVCVDGKWISNEVLEQLAINDGFNSIDDFFQYFNNYFTGKLIHWTDLKY